MTTGPLFALSGPPGNLAACRLEDWQVWRWFLSDTGVGLGCGIVCDEGCCVWGQTCGDTIQMALRVCSEYDGSARGLCMLTWPEPLYGRCCNCVALATANPAYSFALLPCEGDGVGAHVRVVDQ